jgi:hypothetical protein
MSHRIGFIVMILCLSVFQCTAPKKEDPLLVEAARIHNEAVALAERLETHLNQLAKETTYKTDSLVTWRIAIEKWKSQLVEVPGNESHHLHQHSHHDHGAQLTIVTSEQMLLFQQEMKAQLDSIKARINENE